MTILGALGFLCVGIALGLLGGGGSILAVPVLVQLLHYPPQVATPMALPVVGITAAVGGWLRWKRGQLRLEATAMFAACSMTTAFIAARLGAGLTGTLRLILLAITMLAAAVAMWLRASRIGLAAEPPSPRVGSTARVIAVAVVVGALTGVLGVGGGFLIVPALAGTLGLPMAEATATSLVVIALNTVGAGLGWVGRTSIDPRATAAFTVVALAGMAIGTALAPRLPARTLARAFSAMVVVLAIFTLWQQLYR